MKTSRILAVAVLLAVSSLARADEGEALNISTIGGHTYSRCQVVRVYPDGVAFRHSHGMAKVLFTDLTPGWREHFGYDAAKVEAYERKVSEDRAKAREVTAARAAEVQKAWAEAYVQELQAQAILEAQNANQGGYGYGGGYSVLDVGLGNQGYGYGNGFEGWGTNGFRSGWNNGFNRDHGFYSRGRNTYSGFSTQSAAVPARVTSYHTRNNFTPQACRTSGSVRVK